MNRWSLLVLVVWMGTAAAEPVRLNPQQLDALVRKECKSLPASNPAGDEVFLRRATLDLLGRQPTLAEADAFLKDSAPDKRARAIDRLLAQPEFGKHWANYWTDTIRFHVPPPELTFLSYEYFKPWLAGELNKNVGWDKITEKILTATGTVKDSPAATFVGFHQARPAKLAAETARIFLGLQLQCAECHDSKFDHWKREQFHSLAAFFSRASGKLSGLDGAGTTVGDNGKNEWAMPDVKNPKNKGQTMEPVFLTGSKIPSGQNDKERRSALARFITQPQNPWFARAYTNRMWAQLTGRGFYEPVDNLADYIPAVLPETHEALTAHFLASDFDIQGFFRLVMNSQTYQRESQLGWAFADKGTGIHNHLNGDQVFQSLEKALGLPNVRPPAMKANAAIRFPPPPDSTRDIIAKKFQFDPSYCPQEVSRTLGQAMQLMNNEQIQAQINADPASSTTLSKILLEEKDDRKAITRLFRQVLARFPTDRELTVSLNHLREVNHRGEAFEDLLWSLINSAEFTTKR